MKRFTMIAMLVVLASVTALPASAQNLGESAASPSSSDVIGNMRHGFGVWTPNEKVREIQEVLRTRGYYKGPSDGVLNPEFRSAIWNFQRDNGLPRTASLDRTTIAALGLSAAGAAAPGSASGFGAASPERGTTVENEAP